MKDFQLPYRLAIEADVVGADVTISKQSLRKRQNNVYIT